MFEQQLLESFSCALGEADSESTFACGGHIPIILDSETTSGKTKNVIESRLSDQVIVTRPITIRYGAPGQGQTLRLPTETSKDPAFLNLINACEPATFGRDGNDVYDEQYRKATKLDTSDFCTDFCPYETGIIDIVSQLLMPSIKRKAASLVRPEELLTRRRQGRCWTSARCDRGLPDLGSIMKIYKEEYEQRLDQVLEQRLDDIDLFLLDILAEARPQDVQAQPIAAPAETLTGIRAELYKLNFYSGPSGKFKAHVDTPRSETQVGSLVVCLPSEFEGGILSVSHQGKAVGFDWSASSSTGQTPCIQWAAFYSDCCHEVQEVTAGHRVTLTYNLYASRGSGLLAGKNHSMDATHLPIYRPLVDLLRSRTFMNEGGLMAIGLAHTYPYTHALLHRNMPADLKGADMMLFEVLLALDLRAEFIRVMDLSAECADIRVNDRQQLRSLRQ
ncbi:hypothetical protein E4T44_06230 [Aureobasidium sp. EXF-8845]|nr:hypothetical protein E4T44_06230 [Aureobasidium sp. EXF-8845]